VTFPTLKQAVGFAGGVAFCLASTELVLRVWVTPQTPPVPRIADDSLESRVVTTRQIDEGVAVARFSSAGARMTGNPIVSGAPTVVILGDSYVVAREVSDENTMGGWLERIARAAGRPINVRQYGWRGASPARYVAVAGDVLRRWNPAAVVIPISNDDLDERAVGGTLPYFRIDSAGKTEIVPEPPALPAASRRSALVLMAWVRWQELTARAPRWIRRLVLHDPPLDAPIVDAVQPSRPVSRDDIARAVVNALGDAYGDRLVLLYVADVRVTGGDDPDEFEPRLLAACATARVACVSARRRMLDARERDIIARGDRKSVV